MSTGAVSNLCFSLNPAPPVYLSLSSTNYFTNNSEIVISSIGKTNDDALVCHSDLSTCCSSRENPSGPMGMGEWRFPGGANIPISYMATPNDNYYKTRDTKLIRLHRRNNDMYTGTYCCVIPTSGGMETFCANLSEWESFGNTLVYNSNWLICMTDWFSFCSCTISYYNFHKRYITIHWWVLY